MAQPFPHAIPKLKTKVRYRPRRFKLPTFDIKEHFFYSREQRLQVIARLLTQLFKEERIEIPRHRADEVRQYAERLIQIAVQYGDKHKPTMEMANYYLQEKDLIHKLFKVYVPRFQHCSVAYTRMFRLPTIFYPTHYNPGRWMIRDMSVLELRGNPYPPVLPEKEQHSQSLLNILLTEARKTYLQEKQAKAQQNLLAAEVTRLDRNKEAATSATDDVELSKVIDGVQQLNVKERSPNSGSA